METDVFVVILDLHKSIVTLEGRNNYLYIGFRIRDSLTTVIEANICHNIFDNDNIYASNTTNDSNELKLNFQINFLLDSQQTLSLAS